MRNLTPNPSANLLEFVKKLLINKIHMESDQVKFFFSMGLLKIEYTYTSVHKILFQQVGENVVDYPGYWKDTYQSALSHFLIITYDGYTNVIMDNCWGYLQFQLMGSSYGSLVLAQNVISWTTTRVKNELQ